MKVFCVAGYHHTGKTTLVTKLIKELINRGYNVASVKDIHYESFTMEKKGTNSFKHWEASDNVVFARGTKETYQIWHRQLSLKEMLEHLSANYVIIEGMKTAPLPRILCADTEKHLEELFDDTVFAISGKYAEQHTSYKKTKVFHTIKEIKKLANLVEEKVFEVLPLPLPECCDECGFSCYEMVGKILKGEKTRKECVMDNQKKITLKINSKQIKIVPFVQNIIKDVIIGIVKHLRGYEKGKVEIEINSTQKNAD